VDPAFDVFNDMLGVPDGAPIPDEILRRYSPAEYASLADCPFLFIHGKADMLVPYQQSTELNDRLQALGKDSRVLLIDGAQHGFDAFPGSPNWNTAEVAFDQFISEVLRPRK